MRKIIPQTDLLATPHINSKIHVWKKEYGALSDLLSKSGIGWNSTTSMIEIEDESVWDSCRRAYLHVKGIRDGLDQKGDLRERCVPLTPDCLEKDENCMSKHADPKRDAMPRGKKRKTVDMDISILVESLGDFMKFSKTALTDFSGGGDKRSGSSNENRQLNEIMKGIDGLKVSDKLKVCDELVQNSKRLEFFLTLPVEEQEEYVWMLLDGRLYDSVMMVMMLTTYFCELWVVSLY
ncbi:hypothetical protein ACS0TY_018780 [Phlomoides rotata]